MNYAHVLYGMKATSAARQGLWGLKMLLRRRNTTSLTKFHPLTLHTSPNSWELTKHCTCEATTVKNPYTEIKEEKARLISSESLL
jgi:hypothetical protein